MIAELLNLTSLSVELSMLLELLLLLLELLSLSMFPPIVLIPSLLSSSLSSVSSVLFSSLSMLKPNNDVSKVRSELGDFLIVIPIFLDNEFGLDADEEVEAVERAGEH